MSGARYTGLEHGMPFVILKNGYFYRHNSAGYTSSIFEAELYIESAARDQEKATHGDARARPVSDFLPDYEKLQEYVQRWQVLEQVARHELEAQTQRGER